MNFDENLTYIMYGIKNYPKYGKDFSLLEYYAFTNKNISALLKINEKTTKYPIRYSLGAFYFNNQNGFDKISLSRALGCKFSLFDRTLQEDEVRMIYQVLEEENYPLINGVYFKACCRYIEGGIDAIRKENVRKRIIDDYNNHLDKVKVRQKVKTL